MKNSDPRDSKIKKVKAEKSTKDHVLDFFQILCVIGLITFAVFNRERLVRELGFPGRQEPDYTSNTAAKDPFQEGQEYEEVSGEPVAEIPEESLAEVPGEPVAEVPEEPVAEDAEELVAEIPEEPVAEVPEEPVAEVPEEPVAEVTEGPVAEVTEGSVEEVPEEPVEEVPEEPLQGESDTWLGEISAPGSESVFDYVDDAVAATGIPENDEKEWFMVIDPLQTPIEGLPIHVSSAESSCVTYSDNIGARPAANTLDGDDATSWQEGVAGPGINESLYYVFEKKEIIHYIVLKLGNWNAAKGYDYYYYHNYVPSELKIALDNKELILTDQQITHEKKPIVVYFPNGIETERVTVTILNVFPQTVSDNPSDETCISEVAFFG